MLKMSCDWALVMEDALSNEGGSRLMMRRERRSEVRVLIKVE
jgi:hypothetical protein